MTISEVTLQESYLIRKEPSAWTAIPRWLLMLAKRKPLGFSGLVILAIFVFSAVFAKWVAPYSYTQPDFLARLEGPSMAHLLGTDNLGRDLLSRVIYGTRVSFGISFAAVVLAKTLATLMALISGYFGGWFDKLFQRLVDIWISLPTLVILITLIGVLGQGATTMIVVIGLGNAPNASRLVRSIVVSVREEPYIMAAECLGASHMRIMFRHMIPNIAHIVIFSATVTLGSTILIVASLGFLGYGIPPPQPDLGAMLSGDGLEFMRRHPYMAFWPGVAITLIVFAFNVFGDALRDVLDPRLRGG